MLIDIANEYFNAFARKDIELLKDLFTKDVSLRDWNIEVDGLDSVIQGYAAIFDSLESINIEIVHIFDLNSTIIAELIISAIGIEPMRVLDVLTFNVDCKITDIRAYKG